MLGTFAKKIKFEPIVLSNYSSSFWYLNTIRIVFPERVITRYSIRTDLIFEYIFGTRFVQKFGIRSNSVINIGFGHLFGTYPDNFELDFSPISVCLLPTTSF